MERILPKKRQKLQILDCAGSSNVLRCRYDVTTNELQVDYKGGATYRYTGVMPAHWKGLREADSKGAFIARDIKLNYLAEKIAP